MKRSKINTALRELEAMCEKCRCTEIGYIYSKSGEIEDSTQQKK